MNLVTVILEYLLNHPQLQNQKDDEIFNQISLFYDFCNVDCVHRDMCMLDWLQDISALQA